MDSLNSLNKSSIGNDGLPYIKRTLFGKVSAVEGLSGLQGFFTLYERYDSSYIRLNMVEVLESLLNLYIKFPQTKMKVVFQKPLIWSTSKTHSNLNLFKQNCKEVKL